jgi:CubicO group peptidase (beta-lactamase class C family)
MDLPRVLALIERPGVAAQLCVLRDGVTVLERSVGVGRDEPFLLFSAGKPLTAMLVHRLAAQGAFGLDDPIARYWPEFASAGKETITIRQVLQHRSGIPYGKSLARDAVLAPNWGRSVQALARARPRFAAGQVPAYHVLSFGFLLGEIVQRVTGEPFGVVLRREMLDRLGMAGTRLGGPGRSVPLSGRPGVRRVIFNQPFFREAPIPAATVLGTARDLATFYQATLDDPACAEARTPSSDGETDRVLGVPIRWSQGFQLGGPAGGDPARHRRVSRGTWRNIRRPRR